MDARRALAKGIPLSRVIATAYAVFPLAALLLLYRDPRALLDVVLAQEYWAIVATCAVCAFATLLVRGWARALVMVASLLFFLDFVVRPFVLLVDRRTYSFQHEWPVDPASWLPAQLFALAAFAALSLGLALGMRGSSGAEPPAARADKPLRRLPAIIGMAYGVLVVNLALGLLLGEGLPGVAAGGWGWIGRFFPLWLAVVVVIFVLVRDGPRMPVASRALLLGFLAAYVAAMTLLGGRGAIVTIPLTWLVVRIARERDPMISVRALAGIGAACALFALVLADVASALRASWITGRSLAPPYVWAKFVEEWTQHGATMFTLLERTSQFTNGFDHLVIAFDQPRPGATGMFSVGGFLLNVVGSFIPHYDPIRAAGTIPLSRYYPIVYRGLPVTVEHSESWTFAGQAWVFLGIGGLVALVAGGFLFARLARASLRAARPGRAGRELLVVLVFLFFYYVVRGGVTEGQIADNLQALILLGALAAAARTLDRARAERPQPAEDDLPDRRTY